MSILAGSALDRFFLTDGPRNPGLDRVRALAIAMVLIRHLSDHFWFPTLEWDPGPIASFSWTGVQLFFVLSGYLVGGILYDEALTTGRLRVGRFFVRRFARIVPASWACLAIGQAMFSLYYPDLPGSGAEERTLARIVAHALYFSNYWMGPLPLFTHYWSLCVEEHFYLLLPSVTLLLTTPMRRFRNVQPWVAFGAVQVIAALVAYQRFWNPGSPAETEASHFQIDFLLQGVGAAILARHFPDVLSRWLARLPWVSLVGAWLGIALLHGSRFDQPPARFFSIWATPLSWVFAMGVLKAASSVISTSPLVRAWAALSYPLYLWHLPVLAWIFSFRFKGPMMEWAREYPTAAGSAGTLVALSAAILAAIVSFAFVERPFLLWKRKRRY